MSSTERCLDVHLTKFFTWQQNLVHANYARLIKGGKLIRQLKTMDPFLVNYTNLILPQILTKIGPKNSMLHILKILLKMLQNLSLE